jgi:hypothetical protein
MNVELEKLKPNPVRDFVVDPIDLEIITRLRESIHEDGFWSGVVCRQINGNIEIAAGHHRVEAAKLEGIQTAEVYVGNFDLIDMQRIYSRENATQRGNSATAIAGAIASGIRLLAKGILMGDEHLARILATSQKSLETARGQLASGKGIGHELLEKLLSHSPQFSSYVIQQQLISLKKSGHYQRIITEVTHEIETERKELAASLERTKKERAKAEKEYQKAQQEAAKAEKEYQKAKEKADHLRAQEQAEITKINAQIAEKHRAEIEEQLKEFGILPEVLEASRKAASKVNGYEAEFDFTGVAKHLKNDTHVRVFREIALKPEIQKYLPVSKQAALAEQLVKLAAKTAEPDKNNPDKGKITGAFINDHLVELLTDAKRFERKVSVEEQAELEAQDVRIKYDRLQDDFGRHLRGMITAGTAMLDLMSAHRSTTFGVTASFRSSLQSAQAIVTKLNNKLK